MIKNKYDLLGLILKNMNQQREIDFSKFPSKEKIKPVVLQEYVSILCNEGLLHFVAIGIYHVSVNAESTYKSYKSRHIKSFFRFSNDVIKRLIDFSIGVITGIIVSYVKQKFGW